MPWQEDESWKVVSLNPDANRGFFSCDIFIYVNLYDRLDYLWNLDVNKSEF